MHRRDNDSPDLPDSLVPIPPPDNSVIDVDNATEPPTVQEGGSADQPHDEVAEDVVEDQIVEALPAFSFRQADGSVVSFELANSRKKVLREAHDALMSTDPEKSKVHADIVVTQLQRIGFDKLKGKPMTDDATFAIELYQAICDLFSIVCSFDQIDRPKVAEAVSEIKDSLEEFSIPNDGVLDSMDISDAHIRACYLLHWTEDFTQDDADDLCLRYFKSRGGGSRPAKVPVPAKC